MLWWLTACLPDLPAGWEGAEPVADLVQKECAGSPYDTGIAPEVTADLAADPLTVQATAMHFRCAQDVEGFWKQDGATVDVLVQPIDMHPTAVAGCDCLYDLDVTVGSPDPQAAEVVVWRRWDDWNDPNPPVEVGRAGEGAQPRE